MFLFLWGSMTLLPGQSFQWAYHAGSIFGTDDEKVYRSFCDEHNNSYVLIYYSDIMNSQLNNLPINLPSSGLNNFSFLVLVSYDCEGNLRWYRSIQNVLYSLYTGYEENGSVIKTNVSMEMIDNHIILTALGSCNRFYLRDENGHDTLLTHRDSIDNYSDIIISLDTNGSLVWNNSVSHGIYPVTDYNHVYSYAPMCITHDSDHNVIVLSKIYPFTGIPSFPLVNDNLLYMLKYNPEGVLLSVKPFLFDSGMGATNNWKKPHLSYYGEKYYFIGYTFSDTIIVNEQPIPIPEGGYSKPYIACLDSSGHCERYLRMSPSGNCSTLEISDNGDIYVIGGFSDTIGGVVINPGNEGAGMVIVKFDTLFNTVYAKIISHSINCYIDVNSSILLPDNKIAIGGRMTGSIITFDSIQFSFTGYDCYVAIFDEEQMQYVHATRIVSEENALGITALTADNQNNLIVCGSYRGDNVLVGDSVFDNYGDLDIFIGRYGWECGEEADWHSTGIGENSLPESSLKLYPNPAISLVTLESETAVMETVTIFNLMGQQQNSQTVNDHHCTLDISGLAPGLYLLRASFPDGRSETLRFVKQ